MDQGTPKFIVGFGLIMVIILALIMLAPHPILPERSSYLTEDQELQELRQGKVVLYFFYDRRSSLCEIQGEIIKELEESMEGLIVEWMNMDEYTGDRRVTKLADQYQVEATPVIVVRDLHHETKMVGDSTKTQILVEINKLKLG